MVLMNNFQKFHTTLMDLKGSKIQFKLFGNMEEISSDSFSFSKDPPNDTLQIKLVALTSVGTIFCNSKIKLSEHESVKSAKELFSELSISESVISNDTYGNVIIS